MKVFCPRPRTPWVHMGDLEATEVSDMLPGEVMYPTWRVKGTVYLLNLFILRIRLRDPWWEPNPSPQSPDSSTSHTVEGSSPRSIFPVGCRYWGLASLGPSPYISPSGLGFIGFRASKSRLIVLRHIHMLMSQPLFGVSATFSSGPFFGYP